MPSTDKTKSSKTNKRLGRGLGSLLSTSAADFEQSPDQKPVQSAPKKVAKPPSQQPKEKTVSPKTPVPQAIQEIPKEQLLNKVINLAIEKVKPNDTQPRKDFLKDPLKELAASIKEQGVLQPITVRKSGESFEIIAGERRWRASQLAGLQSIPAIVKDVDDQKSMELALIENLQREDLNPLEEAMGYQLLLDDYDLSQQDLATKVGKSRSSITNALRILTLPRDVKEMLRQGLLSVGHGKVLLGVEDPKTQVKLARKTLSKKLSVRALEKEIVKQKTEKANNNGDLDVSDRLANDVARKLQAKLGTKVQIQYKKGKGKIQISFYSDDELNSIVDKIR